METIFIRLIDSWKNTIPTILTSKIPNAHQIAYATLISIVFSAKDKNIKHNIYETTVHIDGSKTEKPLDIFSCAVPIVSNIMANIK